MRMRLGLAVCLAASVIAIDGAADLATAPVASALPPGFSDVAVAAVANPTAIEELPGGRVVVLEQNSGRVRIIDTATGALRGTPALQLPVCTGGERGLLGFTHDPAFASNGRVYVYYTRTAAGTPGGCVNRVSAFVMSGNTINPASEQVLIDNISSVNANHNGGDVEIGKDGRLYVAVGDAGSDPRGDSGSGGANDAAQDLSLLNGKILRLDRFTGAPAPGNPLSGTGTVACGSRGNLPSTPSTRCRELYAWGLRNPFRFAFDPDSTATAFFVNDVGQVSREEINRGAPGANYGWNTREGRCPRGQNPPCAGPPAGLTDPILDYPRSIGTYITAGAFVPDAVWPAAYEGGYLFADGGSGRIWMRTAAGAVDFANPILTGAFGITDMAFVDEVSGTSLYYTLNRASQVRKITVPRPTVVPAGSKTRIAGEPNRIAVLSIVATQTRGPGYIQVLDCAATPGAYANLNVSAPGQTIANLAIARLDADGRACVYNQSATDLVVDLQGYLDPSAITVGAERMLDTRVSRPGRPIPAAGRIRITGEPNGIAVLSIVATESLGPGYLQALPCTATPGAYANLNVSQAGETVANLAVVRLDASGQTCIYTQSGAHIVVDRQGYLSPTAFTPGPQRVLDTRVPRPRPPVAPGGRVPLPVSPPTRLDVMSLVATEATGPGYVQALGCSQAPGAYANLNVDRVGQTRANLAVIGVASPACLYIHGGGHLVADRQGSLLASVFDVRNTRLLDTRLG